ncbi:hypothetical protein SAMN05421690_1003150 [Nitrosomonas sp. Nm51]|uniref:helix-turn-helix domain-containing protein n=1 Tax=Nitrosomonas sp. Nm51 TaxID=133720 RepID=UPI0008B0D8B0|nr:helix-turn-helix domain-containing protein [Nitrosomonas sp. Nm51]SEQ92305.1 hypothetical protein SAMN05421690_1003150 [Nitrosomonas sp. Nm51]
MSTTANYRVELTQEEHEMLSTPVSTGKAAARKITHARILLFADEYLSKNNYTDESIAKSPTNRDRRRRAVRRRFIEKGLGSALNRQVQENRRAKKLNGEAEAFPVATACPAAPEGRKSWTLKLLADHLAACDIVASISPEAVRQTLKKRTKGE